MIASVFAAALVVAVEPPRLPQQPPGASARVHVIDSASPPARKLHLWSSTGKISDPLDLGGGKWEAIYTAPTNGRPQWAVIAAWDEDQGTATAVTIALEGRTEFPADTDPGAQVRVDVGGRHANGRADAAGHARLHTLVGPEARTAKITAVDPAGNTTIEELKLDPAPGGVWLVAPPEVAEGQRARVFAFATGGDVIKLKARGGELQVVQDEPGLLVAFLDARDNVRLTATADAGRATEEVRFHPKPPPAPSPLPQAPSPPPLPAKLVSPRWEVGATSGARYSGDFSGVGLSVEYRRKIRNGRWHLGLDVTGLYAEGSAQSTDVWLGGVGVRGVAELRLPLGQLVAAVLQAGVGGFYLYESKTPVVGRAREISDGTFSLALGAGIVARAGRGLFVLRLEYAWTPIVRLGWSNLDGGMLSVGYRYGRW